MRRHRPLPNHGARHIGAIAGLGEAGTTTVVLPRCSYAYQPVASLMGSPKKKELRIHSTRRSPKTLLKMEPDGWTYLGAETTGIDGFPAILTCTLTRFGYTQPMMYRWRSFQSGEYTMCEMEARISAHPLPPWMLSITGAAFDDTL